MMDLNFLYQKKILVKLKRKTTFASMFLVGYAFSKLHFRSKTKKFNVFVAYNQ